MNLCYSNICGVYFHKTQKKLVFRFFAENLDVVYRVLLLVSHLLPMGLNVLCYQSHLWVCQDCFTRGASPEYQFGVPEEGVARERQVTRSVMSRKGSLF